MTQKRDDKIAPRDGADERDIIDSDVIDAYRQTHAPSSFSTSVRHAIDARDRVRFAPYAWVAAAAGIILIAVLWQAPKQSANERADMIALSISNLSSRLSGGANIKPRIVTSMAALAPLPINPVFEFDVSIISDAVNQQRLRLYK